MILFLQVADLCQILIMQSHSYHLQMLIIIYSSWTEDGLDIIQEIHSN